MNHGHCDRDWHGFAAVSAYSIAVKHGFRGTEEEWLASLKGAPGAPLLYDDLTEEQLDRLRGPAGVSPGVDVAEGNGVTTITFHTKDGDVDVTVRDGTGVVSVEPKGSTDNGNIYRINLSDGRFYEITAPTGPRGKAFTYEDFTEEQLEALKGAKGDTFTYEDLTPEQLESLKGAAGEPGKPCLIDPDTWHWMVFDPDTGQYRDSGVSATELLDENGSGRVRMWFGTVEEYNALEKIEDDVYYNILEGQVAT